jgi:NADH:ubiquinone oxidoreductase subunit K
MNRMNQAPTTTTIVVAIVLFVVGVLGTFGSMVPERVAILAFVAATILLIAGMIFRRI